MCVLSCVLQNGAFVLAAATSTDGRFDIHVSDPTMLDYETTNRHNLVIAVTDSVHT